MADFDAIVIGSGMGGLATAALLTRLHGKRVLVLERHFRAGGFTHTFTRPGGYTWDVGVHYVGELHQDGLPRDAMQLVTGGEVEWRRMPDPYDRLVFPGLRFDWRSGREQVRADLKSAFPAEARAIDAWLSVTAKARSGLVDGIVRASAPAPIAALVSLALRRRVALGLGTTGAWLQEHVRDEALRAVLGARWPDFGLPPAQSALRMHAVIAEHYLDGASYPVGSAAGIAHGAQRVIESGGGRVRVRAEVEQLLLEGGRAVGVRLVGGEELRADVIVSDAGARNTFARLLPPEAPPPFLEELQRFPRGMAHVSLYLGLSAAPSTLGIVGENYWLHDELDQDRLHARSGELLQGRAPLVYLSFPSAKDPRAKAHTAELVAPVPYEPFAAWAKGRWRRRGADYEALKARISEALLARAEAQLPGLRALVAFSELSTPLSTVHFTAHPGGEIYGLPATPARFAARWLSARTHVPGLFLTGADAAAPGVVGALMGGVAATAAIAGAQTFPAIRSQAKRARSLPRATASA